MQEQGPKGAAAPAKGPVPLLQQEIKNPKYISSSNESVTLSSDFVKNSEFFKQGYVNGITNVSINY